MSSPKYTLLFWSKYLPWYLLPWYRWTIIHGLLIKSFQWAVVHCYPAWHSWQEGEVPRRDQASPHRAVQKTTGSSAGAQAPEPWENTLLQEIHLDWLELLRETVQRQESCRRVLPGCCCLLKSKARDEISSALEPGHRLGGKVKTRKIAPMSFSKVTQECHFAVTWSKLYLL